MPQVSYDEVMRLVVKMTETMVGEDENNVLAAGCAIPFIIQNPYTTAEQLMRGIAEISTYVALLVNDHILESHPTPTPKEKIN